MINPSKLSTEIEAAGITDVVGCHSSGRVWTFECDVQDRPDVAAVIAAHDPTETPVPSLEERLEAAELLIATLLEV